MNKQMEELFDELKADITKAYDEGVTMPEAEKLATRLLSVRMTVVDELKVLKLDARMKKNGLRAVRSEVYLDEVNRHDKKPSDSYIENVVNINDSTQAAQKEFDTKEVEAEHLAEYLDIFKDAHIHFRSIAKGSYE